MHPVEEALERADAMMEHGQLDRAIRGLEMALFRFPDDPRVVVRLAELYAMGGDAPSSASYYLKALALDPPDPDLQIRMSAVFENAKEEVEALAEGSDGLPPLRRRRGPDVPTVHLDDVDVDEELLSLVPHDLVAKFRVVPLARLGETLLVATSEPEDRRAGEEIGFVTGLSVTYAIASRDEISTALERLYGLGGRGTKKVRKRSKKKR